MNTGELLSDCLINNCEYVKIKQTGIEDILFCIKCEQQMNVPSNNKQNNKMIPRPKPSIADFIKLNRERQGLSLRGLALKTKYCNYSTVARAEQGDARISNIEDIIDALGYSIKIIQKKERRE